MPYKTFCLVLFIVEDNRVLSDLFLTKPFGWNRKQKAFTSEFHVTVSSDTSIPCPKRIECIATNYFLIAFN